MSDEQPASGYSEAKYTQASNKTKSPFSRPNIDKKIVPETRELLQNYSHVPPNEQSEHVHKIRDRAFEIRAYPCTGLGAFLIPQLCRLQVYPEILKRVKDGATLVDVGCFIGHDLRRLSYDGAPTANLYGVDIIDHWGVGWDMFRDRDKLHAHFIQADLLSDTSTELAALKGAVDIVSCFQVLHQWNLDDQVRACKKLAAFFKPGSLFVGNQLGRSPAQVITNEQMKMTVYWHDPESFANMMERVGTETTPSGRRKRG